MYQRFKNNIKDFVSSNINSVSSFIVGITSDTSVLKEYYYKIEEWNTSIVLSRLMKVNCDFYIRIIKHIGFGIKREK